MFSIVNLARTALAKLLAFLYTVVSLLSAGAPGAVTPPPETPEDFTPVVRFAVCSDIHLSGEEGQEEAERFADMIQSAYAYADESEYKGFDALCVAGDMTNNGKEVQYEMFNRIANENLKEGTEFLVCMGNHEFIEYRDVDASVGTEVFEKMMGHDDDTHAVINGYHFILCSYSEDGKTFNSKKDWIEGEIKKAVADSGDKPVFVFHHPAPFATIYGSISWGDVTLPTILSKYPQVVDFSGHSHYPVNDPRSIWQGRYTAFGCGTLSYFETDLDGISGNFPYDTSRAAQFYIVEADAQGNVVVKPYDLLTGDFFGFEYYLTDLAGRNRDYSYNKNKKRDEAPVFTESTQIGTSVNEAGETVLTFTGAQDNYVVESYKVSVTKNGLPFFSDNFSGKYMYQLMDDIYDVNLGALEPGKYSVSITALNAFAETSKPLNYSFDVK